MVAQVSDVFQSEVKGGGKERRSTTLPDVAGPVARPPDGGNGRLVLNCQPHDVPILVAAHRLKPLGNPPANSVKYFATLELLEPVKDRTCLARGTNALNQDWQRKNAAKKNGLGLVHK
jgi:hypothetical protein